MILNHDNDSVQSIPEFIAFLKTVSLREALIRCCKNKLQGVAIFDIFCTLFVLVFRQRNFWRWVASGKDTPSFGQDTVYRFLNSSFHNWRDFLSRIAKKAIAFLVPLTSREERKVFVVDDSVYDKNRSKKLELLSFVYEREMDDVKCYLPSFSKFSKWAKSVRNMLIANCLRFNG